MDWVSWDQGGHSSWVTSFFPAIRTSGTAYVVPTHSPGTGSQLLLLWSTALCHGSYPSRSYALILITTATTIND